MSKKLLSLLIGVGTLSTATAALASCGDKKTEQKPNKNEENNSANESQNLDAQSILNSIDGKDAEGKVDTGSVVGTDSNGYVKPITGQTTPTVNLVSTGSQSNENIDPLTGLDKPIISTGGKEGLTTNVDATNDKEQSQQYQAPSVVNSSSVDHTKEEQEALSAKLNNSVLEIYNESGLKAALDFLNQELKNNPAYSVDQLLLKEGLERKLYKREYAKSYRSGDILKTTHYLYLWTKSSNAKKDQEDLEIEFNKLFYSIEKFIPSQKKDKNYNLELNVLNYAVKLFEENKNYIHYETPDVIKAVLNQELSRNASLNQNSNSADVEKLNLKFLKEKRAEAEKIVNETTTEANLYIEASIHIANSILSHQKLSFDLVNQKMNLIISNLEHVQEIKDTKINDLSPTITFDIKGGLITKNGETGIKLISEWLKHNSGLHNSSHKELTERIASDERLEIVKLISNSNFLRMKAIIQYVNLLSMEVEEVQISIDDLKNQFNFAFKTFEKIQSQIVPEKSFKFNMIKISSIYKIWRVIQNLDVTYRELYSSTYDTAINDFSKDVLEKIQERTRISFSEIITPYINQLKNSDNFGTFTPDQVSTAMIIFVNSYLAEDILLNNDIYGPENIVNDFKKLILSYTKDVAHQILGTTK